MGSANRTIGVIGGMSWHSTALVYRRLNELVAERLGGVHSARLLLASVDFATIEASQRAGAWDAMGDELAEHAARLEAAGADLVMLATNTMHKVAPAIVGRLGVPFVHIADAIAADAARLGTARVGLLGTRYTMAEPFLVDALSARGVTAIVPGPATQSELDAIIFDELVLGVTTEPSRARYRAELARLASDEGCEAIVLGCTEIGLLVDERDSPVALIDTVEAHVRLVVDLALAD